MKQVLCIYPTHRLSCLPGLWVVLCNAGCSGLCVQDALCISFQPILWPSRQAVYSVLLLFWTLIFPRSLPREGSGREKHPGRWQWWELFSVCLPTCPAAAPGVVEASWSVAELAGLQTAGSRNVCHFLLHFLFPPVISWVITQDCVTQDMLHLQLVRSIASFHLSLKREVLATGFDLQLNGKSYSIFPGPQEW